LSLLPFPDDASVVRAGALPWGNSRAAPDGHTRPATRTRFAQLGLDVAPGALQTPEGLAAFHKVEIEAWWPIIRAAGIVAE